MNLPTVAICIPTYNQAAYLERAVRSALAQTYPGEVWISDDASTDQTPAVMSRLLNEFPHINHYRHKQNLGIKENPRWTLQQPQVEYIVRLDSDDELHPNYVQKLLESLLAHPQAGYAHAAVQEIDKNGLKQKLRLLSRDTGFQSGEDGLRASVSGYRVAANICIFRRKAIDQINFYRDLSFCEDWDLAVRLADAGWGNVYVNEILSNYRVWDTPVRSRRKLAEIVGCRRVFEESLIPAFTKRNWSLDAIHNSRRQLALRHTECLRSDQYTETERSDLRQALCQLGNSSALQLKFRWIRTPIAPLFQLQATLKRQAKVLAKRVLFRIARAKKRVARIADD
jgi:glycosyltransferase involved in cell wall biosynthesis